MVTRDDIMTHFLIAGDIEELRWTCSPSNMRKGYCWIRYILFESAIKAVQMLHHSALKGTTLHIKLELSENQEQYFPSASVQSSAIPRHVRLANKLELEDNQRSKKKKHNIVSYSSNGVLVNGTEYPTPTGAYLLKLLETCTSNSSRNPLIDFLVQKRFGTKQSKEISESMAIVNALWKLGSLTSTIWTEKQGVRVYVLGDGKVPFTAVTLALYFPSSWEYISIDPLLDEGLAGLATCVEARSIKMHTCLSQEYKVEDCAPPLVPAVPSDESSAALPTDPTLQPISIVVACHSHAPLQEFWDRVQAPKYCIAMPCCGKGWSSLQQPSLYEYDDYEVFSPKRRLFLYHST